MLKGLGTVAIGLPFMEEMLVSTATAVSKPAAAAVTVRSFNVFFGLGVPAPLQAEGYDGVLEPLKDLGDKLLIMLNVGQVRADGTGINAHFDGASASFTAEAPAGEAKSGGPSIDQVVRNHYYPDGLPSGIVPTLAAGTYFRRSRVSRYVHTYNMDGTVAATMQERPRDLFERVFGSIDLPEGMTPRDLHLKRSVLDSVVNQYKFLTSQRSPLGAQSKARVADHLDRVREFEQRAYSHRDLNSDGPVMPSPSRIKHGGEADPGGEGIDMQLDDLVREWRLMADLYALAIQTDKARFGALTFLAAGERLRMKGDYEYNGRKIFTFDDAAQHNKSGSAGCSHEWWHKFREEKENTELRAHAHMKMREVAYFLKRLDEADCIEGNGRSILENSMITVSTESGDGRHSDVKRELSGVFHAITGANGRFKTGQIMDVAAEGLDVYNTMLEGMDVHHKLGPSDRDRVFVDKIRA